MEELVTLGKLGRQRRDDDKIRTGQRVEKEKKEKKYRERIKKRLREETERGREGKSPRFPGHLIASKNQTELIM